MKHGFHNGWIKKKKVVLLIDPESSTSKTVSAFSFRGHSHSNVQVWKIPWKSKVESSGSHLQIGVEKLRGGYR